MPTAPLNMDRRERRKARRQGLAKDPHLTGALMDLAKFAGRHSGEKVLVVGNGVSLNNVPLIFLQSHPTFCVNYIKWYLPDFNPTYWVALDPKPLECVKLMGQETTKFVPLKHRRRKDAFDLPKPGPDLVYFQFEDTDMGPLGSRNGTNYSTSLLSAAHLAFHMDAKSIGLVGFDCTRGQKPHKPTEAGKTGAPHFYDPDEEPKYQKSWDEQMGQFAEFIKAQGGEVVNLSEPTMCTTVTKGKWYDYA